MVLRRALVTAPLAVLVALAAHAIGFGSNHLLGGVDASWMFAAGIGGTLLVTGVALLWLAFTQSDIRRAEQALLSFLPAKGGIAAGAALLGISGFAVFACGELIEGRSPGGTWTTALALAAVAVIAAFAIRACLRWVAAGGVALAALLAWALTPAAFAVALAPSPPATSRFIRYGRHLGRSPPLTA